MRSERFHTPAPAAVRVRVPAGQIDVETVDGEETAVEVEPLNDAGREAMERLILERRGSEVVAALEERRGFGIRARSPRLGVRIRCPHFSDLTVQTVAADVDARGRYGRLDVNSVSADVRVEHVEGDARLRTGSGDVRVAGAGGGLGAQTVSGDVDVQHVGAAAELRTVSGDIRVAAAASSVTMQTVSGDQELDAAHEGEVHAKSVSGDITVGVARGAAVWIDAKSVSGSTRSELELSDEPVAAGENGRRLEIRANALSGDIRVTRAG
jgi:DUF4097 and DUF4098 domain-containing protein YvlB